MPLSPVLCLLVDDDLDDQEIFDMALTKINSAIECHFANDGAYAVERLREDKFFTPRYIFIDINMPRMNGIQCLKEIKKIDRIKPVPVYMYSTAEDEKMMAEARQYGAVDIIIKPTSLPGLVEILSSIVKPLN